MVHYRIHKCPPTVPILIPINLVHVPNPTSWKSFLILSSHLVWVFQVTFSLRFPHQKPVRTSSFSTRATYPTYFILLDLITRIMFGDEYVSLNTSLCSFIYFAITLSLLGPICSSLPYSQTPSYYVPHSMLVTIFTPIQINRQNYSSVYLNLYIIMLGCFYGTIGPGSHHSRGF